MGKANIVLGYVSLVRLITEVQFFWTVTDRSKLFAFAAFDAAVGALWVLSGLCLVSREPSLMITAMAAGAAAARTILSGMLLGPRLAESVWKLRDDPEFLQALAAAGSRVLHYGIEFVYWPVVLFQILKACEAPRPRWQPDPAVSTGSAFGAACLIAGVLEAALLDPLT